MTTKKYLIIFVLFIILISLGTLGFVLIEGFPILDAIYMTVITLTTVGYKEVHELSKAGKIFNIGFILVGIGFFGYAISQILAFFVSGEVNNLVKKKRVKKLILALIDHVIVCGFGKVGQEVCSQLTKDKKPFIVLENDQIKVQEAMKKGYLAIFGDATDEILLKKAKIGNATGIIAAVGNISENVYITLAAKAINEEIIVIARGGDFRSQKILYRAGANKVISPSQIGGKMMVQTLSSNPTAEKIINIVQDKNVDILLAEIKLGKKSPMIGKTLASSDIRKITDGIMVIGIKPIDKSLMLNPDINYGFCVGDTLIALGTKNQIKIITQMVSAESGEIKVIKN